MIDTLEFFEELKETLEPTAAKKIAELMGKLYRELSNTVTKTEFRELTEAVKELTQAQRRTEQGLEDFKKATQENFNRVWQAIDELADAQKRTEARVEELAEAQKRTEVRVEELAEAQSKSEQRLTRLENVVQELAEAQKRTEVRVEELTEAQSKSEQRLTRLENVVEELAEAQKRTEQEVRELAKGLKETRQMVGNLSDTVGYGLEDRAMKSLPELFRQRYSIEVKDRLVRKFVKYNGKHDEINIFGLGKRRGKKLYIIGEAKSRLSKRHVDDLIKLVKRLENNEVISGERFLFIVTYSARPEAESMPATKALRLYGPLRYSFNVL